MHFTYTHFSGCRHRRILLTQTFRVAVTVAVYILLTQTCRVAGVLHFALASPLGGDVEEICNFQARKIRSHGTIFLATGGTRHAWLETFVSRLS